MVRTLVTAILVSCILGASLGVGVAYHLLTTNAWQANTETTSYEKLAEIAFTLATNPNAKASIEKTTHHFGVMDVKATGSHDFIIKNVGSEDLILALDRTTCSCTGIDITPSRVPPGKTATCHLKYNAEQALTGKFSQGGIIRTNDPDHREIQLMVQGVFTNPVVLNPTSVNFSRVPTSASKTLTIRFYGFEDEPLQLSNPTWSDKEHFDFQWEPAKPNDLEDDGYLSLAKSVVEGTITLKPGLPVGSFQEWFQVKTNYASLVSVQFVASGQVVGGSVSVSGQGYDREKGIANLGRTVTGKSISRELLIQFSGSSSSSASVQVKSIEPSWLRVTLPPPKNVGSLRIFSLLIEIPENAPSGSYGFGGDSLQSHVTLETNDESMPVLKIPLQFAVERQ